MKKLKKGQEFKNWRYLCEYFDWKVYKSGSCSQIAQVKQLNSLCEYHKEGRKIIIDKVFDKPKVIEDKRKTVDYIQDIEYQLIRMLMEEDEEYNGTSIKTTYYLLRKFGMINNCFKYGSERLDKSATYLNMPIEVVEELFNSTKSANTRTIESVFKNLEKKKLIKWTNGYSITLQKELDANEIVNVEYNVVKETDKYGDEYIKPTRTIVTSDSDNIDTETREASDEEIKVILSAEKKTFKHFGVESMSDIFRKGVSMKEYYTVVNTYIRKEIPTFVNYWRSYKIIYIMSNLVEYADKNNIGNPERLFNKVNKSVQDKIVENAKKRAKKTESRTDDRYDYRLEDEFIGQVDSFNKTFISVKGKSQLHELKTIRPNYTHYESQAKKLDKELDSLFGNN